MKNVLMRVLITMALVFGLTAAAEAAYRRNLVVTFPSRSWTTQSRMSRGRYHRRRRLRRPYGRITVVVSPTGGGNLQRRVVYGRR